jgi:hypothetical protein
VLHQTGMGLRMISTVLIAIITMVHFPIMTAEVGIEEFARQPVLGCVYSKCGWNPNHLIIIVLGEASFQDVAGMERILSGSDANQNVQATDITAEKRELVRRRYFIVERKRGAHCTRGSEGEKLDGDQDKCDRSDAKCIGVECNALVTAVAAPPGGVWEVLAALEADILPLRGLLFIASNVHHPTLFPGNSLSREDCDLSLIHKHTYIQIHMATLREREARTCAETDTRGHAPLYLTLALARTQALGARGIAKLATSVSHGTPIIVSNCSTSEDGPNLIIGGLIQSVLRTSLDASPRPLSLEQLTLSALSKGGEGARDPTCDERPDSGDGTGRVVVLSVVFSSPWMLEAQIIGFRKHLRSGLGSRV